MAEVLCQLFRIPPKSKPMTIMMFCRSDCVTGQTLLVDGGRP